MSTASCAERCSSLRGLDFSAIDAIAISSVVPPLDFTLFKMAQVYFHLEPLFVRASNAGIPVLYDDPNEVGADRIVNSVAALTKYGAPCIVVDFGTATTFDVISRAGEYLGGSFVLGFRFRPTLCSSEPHGCATPRFAGPRN